MNRRTKKNFLKDTSSDTLLGLYTTNISVPNLIKKPLDSNINQNVFVFGVIKAIFDIHLVCLNLKAASEMFDDLRNTNSFCE